MEVAENIFRCVVDVTGFRQVRCSLSKAERTLKLVHEKDDHRENTGLVEDSRGINQFLAIKTERCKTTDPLTLSSGRDRNAVGKIEGHRSNYLLGSSTVRNSYQQNCSSQSPVTQSQVCNTKKVHAPDFASKHFLCELAGATFSYLLDVPMLTGLKRESCKGKSINPGPYLKIKFGFLPDIISHQPGALVNTCLKTVLTRILLVPIWKIQKQNKQ